MGGVVGALVLMVGTTTMHGTKSFGSLANCSAGYTCYNYLDILNGIVIDGTQQIGASGTALSNVIATRCSMIANNVSTGTTTQYAYCTGVTGVTALDGVAATFATSSTLYNDGWQIVGAKASTTAGTIDFAIIGIAGKAMSNVSTIGSTTVIQAAH